MKFILALVFWVALFSQGYTNSLDSCVGRCDYGTDSDFTCQCNTACERFRDCCFDYSQICKSSFSCKSRCGEAYNSQNECHCNSKCSQYDNCCSDYNDVCGASGSSVTDAEIKSVSEALYALDSNKASGSQLIIDPQTLISNSQTGAQTDYSSKPLFRYLDEGALFSRPTYAALLAVLDNYRRMTGQTESFTQQQLQEQDRFVRETMSNTAVGRELFSFLRSKGIYSSEEEFIEDLKKMWFGLYSRSSGAMDSSGFEHIFAGEVKGGKVSGFHNWIQFYLLEKRGQLNYYSHSFDGPWLSYPDVLGMQFNWNGYYKQVGSAIIGCSPEFDFALYSLCYITRPGKMCYLSVGGKELRIQTYTWDNSSYGNGKKYIGSAYPPRHEQPITSSHTKHRRNTYNNKHDLTHTAQSPPPRDPLSLPHPRVPPVHPPSHTRCTTSHGPATREPPAPPSSRAGVVCVCRREGGGAYGAGVKKPNRVKRADAAPRGTPRRTARFMDVN
ncbi:LOW QUALITY PROTEIN: uridylate-specific endoribonuclease-like [Boleophthalmus pectinirostris]|uniref:LOW QUALITY PROTEIN: uridylate-specific endoribonuclease-like n=1 Tax=Boleophthalmus pectinirostris TaxID=150288 RepID=UPI00243126EB|nr:LOW QUALITY PROTEIN: uridylate-specific endoribonuclease-like [Boleophthalmus pectinirostris]